MKEQKCRILIAEDEQIERESLLSIIKNAFHEVAKVETAKNGKEALEKFQNTSFDLVMMDINMPGITGLEAIRQMKATTSRKVIYLILTSYDYFSYAQEAIHLGVNDFILKPANPQTIIDAIAKYIAQIKSHSNQEIQTTTLVEKYAKMQKVMEDQCFYAILSKQSELNIQSTFQMLNLHVESGMCIVLEGKENSEAWMNTLKENITDLGFVNVKGYINGMYVFFLFSNRMLQQHDLDVLMNLIKESNLLDRAIGIGSVQTASTNFYHSYVQAVGNMRNYGMNETFFLPQEECVIEQVISTKQVASEIANAFERYNDEEITKITHEYANYLLSKKDEEIYREVKDLIKALLDILNSKSGWNIDIDTLPAFTFKEEEKYHTLEIQIHYLLNKILQPLRASQMQQGNSLIKKAEIYIQHNFRKPISLRDVAKELQVTPFYLSRILNNNHHKNFTDIVNDCRIEEAKRLLKKQTRMKDVAFEVGYQSQSYFAKMFKKSVGITPKEYQDMFH